MHICSQAARLTVVLLLLIALTSAGASSAQRVCKPVLEPEKAEVDSQTGVELKPDPMSDEASADNMAGNSRPYSEQDAAQISQWFSPTVEKPQPRRLDRPSEFDASAVQSDSRRGQPVIGSLAEAAPAQNDQATLVGARPSGTM